MSKNRPTYPLVIESASNYAFAIKRSNENKTFDFFRNVSTKFYRELPAEIRNELHNSILHGTCMLSSEPELNAYMYDMGKMHNAKLRCAYKNLSSEYSCADTVDIIDYGCGQGLGIIAFADHLREACVDQQVRRIVLIEPSEMALRRAALLASVLFPNAELVTINKGFDDLVDGDILSDEDTPTMHILSNVLDLAKTEQAPDGYYDLNRFADLILANIKGENQFVGVEPLFNNEITDKKFPYFWKRVGISIDFKLKCNKGEFVEGKNWTCVIVCGEKNNLSSFQKLCKEYDEVGELCDGMIKVARYKLYWSAHCHCNDEYTVTEYGFVNESCEEIIPCQYEKVKDFRNGLAFVFDQVSGADWQYREVWGAINKKGQTVIPFEYKSLEWVDDEFILATNENGIIKYDKYGQICDVEDTRIIEYTSVDEEVVEPQSPEVFDAKIVANTYANGVGRIIFDKAIKKIGDGAFYDNRLLTSISIPQGVESIGRAAFQWCINLERIAIPDSVSVIKENAFYECLSVNALHIPDGVISIGDEAFYGCKMLETVILGKMVALIGKRAFCDCYNLKNIILPDSLTSIEEGAFFNSGIESIIIPNSVILIGDGAFSSEDLSKLREVALGNNIKIIGGGAFELSLITTLSIPESVTSIGEDAFSSCRNLKDVKMLCNITELASRTFLDCTSLENITLPQSLIKIGDGLFCGCCNLKSINIPNGVTSIGHEAFSGCSSLTGVTIPDSVISIGQMAFQDCYNLTSITIPDSVVHIGCSAFCECRNLTSVNIPDGITSLESSTFFNCTSLVSITIPDSIVLIENTVFAGCNSIKVFKGKFAADGGRCLIKDNTIIAYAGGSGAAYTIPNGVARVGMSIFSHCDNLNYITIPNSVTAIDSYVFAGCPNLHGVYCRPIVPPTGTDDMFIDNALDCKIYVPIESVEAYRSAPIWSKYADRIFAIEQNYSTVPNRKTETEKINEKRTNVNNMELYPQQQEALDAIRSFLESEGQVFILKGYAGTGKTTMIKAMLPMLHSMGKQTTLMAPTGRAAKVLMNKTGENASTIHRTIYSVNRLTSVRHDENGELIKMVDHIYKDKEETRKHDVVEFWFCINQDRAADYNPQNAVYIVDEASMISSRKTTNELFHFGSDVLLDDLLEYAELLKGGKIIFIGDPAQLPPVGDNCSAALNEAYFQDKGIGVTSFELTDIVRQAADSAILENAMMLRDLLQTQIRNTLSFNRCDNEVEDVQATTMVAKYVEMYPEPTFGDTAIICYSNKMAKGYNDAIRTYYYPGEKNVQVGDVLQVVKNYYRVDEDSQSRDALYNGDFVKVLDVSTEVEIQSAPIWTKPGNKRELISLQFRDITVQAEHGDIYKLKIIDSLLNSTNPGLTPNEHTALYINFRMRNPNLPKDKEAQAKMLMEDPYYNALNVKYGYAITGHKSQGGDWDTVFVDYDGRTGLDNDSLRWMYTATTRAKKQLYGVHMPKIQPFDKLHFRPITKLNKLATNAQIVGNVGNVDMLSSNASASQKAKCLSAIYALGRIGCKVDKVEQLQYKDRYYIQVADVVERYDCTYNGAGYYTAYNALDASENNQAILDALQSEECYTFQFDYLPSHRVLVDLHAKMRSVCDELGVRITNIVEDIKQYNVVYFLKTTGKYSYIKFYFDKNMFVTYGHPYSDIEGQDVLLNEIIAKLS